MKFGSLFSGIGGMDLGLERAGMECAWQVEIDEWCQRVLAKHWPDVPKYRDIKEVDFGRVEPVELLAGGFPCQDLSYAGKGAGLSGQRSGLWGEFKRAVCDLRPEYVLVENVPGLLGRGMGVVLGDLASLGYDAEWESLPAVAFGALHRRNRVFIVAYTQHRRSQQQKGLVKHQRQCEEVGRTQQPLGDGPKRSLAHPHNQRELQRQGGIGQERGRPCDSSQDVAYAKRSGLQGGVGSWRSREGRAPGVFANGCKRPGGVWEPEPPVGRVAHGIPRRVDRLRGLGNAVVPQVAQWIGERIVEVHQDKEAA